MTEPKAPQPGDILIAIHEFEARSLDEVTLNKGDRIELVEADDDFGDGWFLGRNISTGNTGLFPEVYTRPAPPTKLPPLPQTSTADSPALSQISTADLPTPLQTATADLSSVSRNTNTNPSAPSKIAIKDLYESIDAALLSQSQTYATGHDDSTIEDLERITFLRGGIHRVLGPGDVNPFEVCAYLGQGTVGAVEEVAMPTQTSATFVRKKILLPRSQRTERLQLVQEEVEILKSLTHIHIVRCIGTYEDATQVNRPSSYCLLMLPVGNGDLKAFLDDTPREPILERSLRLSWLQKWFVCLSSALNYMHSQGVRHQDIKPSNIVFRGNSIYLTDFSSSSRFVIGQTTSTESPFRCTAMYGAPEVTGKYLEDGTLQKHGRGSDIFALGCVFCEMLTVLSGSLVSSFQEYLIRDGAKPKAGNRSLLYSQKLTLIDDWFQKLGEDGLPFTLTYYQCIKPMLRTDTTTRCIAATAQQNFKRQEELQKNTVECSCEK